MARGWESKAVEAQIEAAAEKTATRKLSLTAEEAAQLRGKQRLLLARKHVVQQLATAQNARHRQMLEQALCDLDEQLARAVSGQRS